MSLADDQRRMGEPTDLGIESEQASTQEGARWKVFTGGRASTFAPDGSTTILWPGTVFSYF